MLRAHVVVHGRVQGVGFRAGVAVRAQSLGVAGWVRNRADGAVEAVFEGVDEAVASLVRWCGTGPRGAAVTRVETVDGEAPEGLASFQVR